MILGNFRTKKILKKCGPLRASSFMFNEQSLKSKTGLIYSPHITHKRCTYMYCCVQNSECCVNILQHLWRNWIMYNKTWTKSWWSYENNMKKQQKYWKTIKVPHCLTLSPPAEIRLKKKHSEKFPNSVTLKFISNLSLSTLKWIPMWQGSNNYSALYKFFFRAQNHHGS